MRGIEALPSSREAPEDILRRLREVDSRAYLYWFPDEGPRWMLGVLDWTWPLYEAGSKQYRQALGAWAAHPVDQRRAWAAATVGLMKMAGFRFWCAYHQRDPDGRIVQDFTERWWAARQDVIRRRMEQEIATEKPYTSKDNAEFMTGITDTGLIRDAMRYERVRTLRRAGTDAVVPVPSGRTRHAIGG